MTNFFGTNTVVPNGYIYTSHKGSEYIVLEGVWFNHHDLKMVDPNKTQKMNEAAISQIMKHNSTSKQMIGESFNFTGNTYVYLGNGRFTENGIVMAESALLTELIADDQRVYDVSRETLQKEWNELQFNILPPHAEDITIPAGMDVHGFKYVPKGQRFIDATTGRPAEPQVARKLHDAGVRLARQEASKHTLIPLNSTLVLGNSRAVWNGTEFCDNEGNIVVPAAKSKEIFSKYQQFVNDNPQEFPSLVNSSNKEQRYGVGPKPNAVPGRNFGSVLVKGREEVTESDDSVETSSETVPEGFSITSKAGVTYIKKGGQWISTQTKKAMNSSAAKSIERAAKTKIQKHNETSPVKIGVKWTSNKGKEYTYVGDDRFISDDGKLIPKSSAKKILNQLNGESKPEEPEKEEQSVEDDVKRGEDSTQPQIEPTPEPEKTTSTEPPEDTELDSLAKQIKEHPAGRKIQVLLTRGDKVSILAADILLSGIDKDAVKILKALNSSDE